MTPTVLVVPCYNEAARFPSGVVCSFLQQHPAISMVLVNDGSRDGTTAVLEQVRQRMPAQVQVVDRKENRGKAETVREGMVYALKQFPGATLGFWDADLATPLPAVLQMIQILEQRPGIRMVFGARVSLLGRDIRRQPRRHYLGRVFATVVSLMLKLPIYDTQCGAKLFRAGEGLENLFNEPFSSRWVFDVEIIARWIQWNRFDRAKVRGTIFELPLDSWEDVDGSKVKPSDFLKAPMELLEIYRRYLASEPRV
jgi:dolichyl-phosphate beta-glucosyltransferase